MKKKVGINKYFPLLILFIIIYTSGAKAADEVIKLSLQGVTELAFSNSLDIQIAKFDAYIQRKGLGKAESIFDTFLKAQADFIRDKKMRPTTLLGEEEETSSFSLGLEKKLPTGTTLSLDMATEKVRTDSPFSTLNPYHEAEAGFSITQALGKNFFGLSDRADIKITKLDIINSDFLSLESIENTLYSVQKAYWDFVLKETQLAISEDMLKKAEELQLIYKEKIKLGLIEEAELLAIQALVNTRQSELLIALLEKERAKNELFFLLNKGDFQQEITAEDSLNITLEPVDLYAQLRGAIEKRRDYKRIENELKKNNINLVVKKNALWPEIDLTASFMRNNLHSDRDEAWDGISKNSNDSAAVTLEFKLPLENRQAKAELKEANLEKSRLLLQLKRTERKILQELNNKVSEVNISQNQAKLFQDTVGIHEKKLDKQIVRLNYGRSDADTLIRYEEDLLEARLALARALFRYRVGLIELELTKNSLLDKYWNESL